MYNTMFQESPYVRVCVQYCLAYTPSVHDPVEVAKLFLNPWNLGISWQSVRFLAVCFRTFSPWSLNRFPSSFSSSHDVLTYWEANSG